MSGARPCRPASVERGCQTDCPSPPLYCTCPVPPRCCVCCHYRRRRAVREAADGCASRPTGHREPALSVGAGAVAVEMALVGLVLRRWRHRVRQRADGEVPARSPPGGARVDKAQMVSRARLNIN